MPLKIPILTYHSAQVDGHDYGNNDHIALADDLAVICDEGFRVVPAAWVVEWISGVRPDSDMERAIVITCDDGCTMDFRDMLHPAWGWQRGFLGILEDLRRTRPGAQPSLHFTAFVIGSPETRMDLAAHLPGPEWISDDWWSGAIETGMMAIENHSWDHNHPASRSVCQREGVRGRFDNIATFEECDAEVMLAAAYIERKAGARPRLFAYPWGQSSSYLRTEYFPEFRQRHGCTAAFTAHDGLATKDSPLWAIPRVVFRANWTDQQSFRALLTEAGRSWV